MELLYLWIENFRNIRHQGFNFSTKYKFDFTELQIRDKKVIGGNIIIHESLNHIDDFFGQKIANITGIIGENGSGKSSILDLIRSIPPRESKNEYYGNPDLGFNKTFKALLVFTDGIYT